MKKSKTYNAVAIVELIVGPFFGCHFYVSATISSLFSSGFLHLQHLNAVLHSNSTSSTIQVIHKPSLSLSYPPPIRLSLAPSVPFYFFSTAENMKDCHLHHTSVADDNQHQPSPHLFLAFVLFFWSQFSLFFFCLLMRACLHWRLAIAKSVLCFWQDKSYLFVIWRC